MLDFSEIVENAKSDIDQVSDIVSLNSIRAKYIGKKGCLTIYIMNLRNLPIEKRSKIGIFINQAKRNIKEALKEKEKKIIHTEINNRSSEFIDISLPGRRIDSGNLHPITRTIVRIESFFKKLGFITKNGPEIETDYYNFDALNIPIDHPVRTEHDTFWFDSKHLLRTHTSGVQIRTMKNQKPPIRIISSGRVYRNDSDQTHTPMFHQVEGLIVDKNINFSNLKSTIHDFLCYFFEENLQIRFRPSYFPFTKLSIEIDIMNKNKKWIEVLGCGIVHPNVLHNVNINSKTYSGFAFGIGVERLTMLRYDVTDLRLFFENNLRFLKQFK